ncbi:hypothetical protein QZN10_39725 [Burkholderia contaminans]|jgi:hypothetical protein|uniref:hypothetical protein n=1 Tax=Burkholderia contaminans TaxID=488447 RepID=UPI000B2D9926|nr:hypothetical protein [Burkholderia contaminans]MDN8026752.1 hypothetical protein [Burkholderia contaminans]
MEKEKQLKYVTFRTSKEIKDDMELSAKELGMSLSSYFRFLHAFSKWKREEMKQNKTN